MKDSKGFEQCNNGQIAVDAEQQIIIATDLSNNAADLKALKPMVRRIQEMAGQLPERLLADAGYRSEKNLRRLEKLKIDTYVSLGREGKEDGSEPTAQPATKRMRSKLATEDGKRQYAWRKAIPEPVFGWIKNAFGFRQFSLRGERKAAGEWDLVCLATNLRRMSRLATAAG